MSKLLLRRGQRYEQAQAWSAKHLRCLRARCFEDACSQATFADYLALVELLTSRRRSLLSAVELGVPERTHAP
jgi:hypothetical protein